MSPASAIRANLRGRVEGAGTYDRDVPRRRPGRSPGVQPGRVAIGTPDAAEAAPLLEGGTVVAGFELGDDPWSVTGVVCVGRVVDDASHARALDAALRGADVVADVADERRAAFVDDVTRSGLVLWSGVESTAQPEWAPLLDALAGGVPVAEAARRCHLSVRSAHRRLATARQVLGVATTAAAVARWSARRTAG